MGISKGQNWREGEGLNMNKDLEREIHGRFSTSHQKGKCREMNWLPQGHSSQAKESGPNSDVMQDFVS